MIHRGPFQTLRFCDSVKILVRNTKHSGRVRRGGDQAGIDQKKPRCPIQVDNRDRQFHREQQTHRKDVLSEVTSRT